LNLIMNPSLSRLVTKANCDAVVDPCEATMHS